MSSGSLPNGNRNGRHLVIAAALAAMTWLGFLSHVSLLMGTGQPESPLQAIELQVVELPPEPHASETPADNVQPDAVTASHATPREQRHPQAARNSTAHHASRELPLPHPSPDAPQGPTATPQNARATVESKVAQPPGDDIARPSVPSQADSSAPPSSQQARLLSRPLPEVPDDLRDQAFQAVAVARFAVHADGTFDVELIKPTQNPRLNQILLATLGKWRFFPAIENGRSVESHQDVRVHFNVN